MPRRVTIIGAGVSSLEAAWALNRHPERFDFRVYEAQAQVGGNAVTADMPQDGRRTRRPSQSLIDSPSPIFHTPFSRKVGILAAGGVGLLKPSHSRQNINFP